MSGQWIPIILFLSIASVVIGSMFFASKNKQAKQATLQAAIERGDVLTPEMVAAIGSEPSTPATDYRRGILLLSVSIGIAIFGRLVDPGDVDLLGIAAIPAMLGVGYLFIWKFGPRD